MRYDAFISYRHGELDGLVAEKLHKMLETYRIPGAIAKKVGKKKLARVFRDREELPTSSNLSDSINEALETSAFLLLICSRRTCASQWVMREVERFGELHGKDRIITLLIDGEPDESFPPGLRERQIDGETVFVEPLAADIRAETWKESLKLLKEEKLRLLAPVLGCAFDDLRRRHLRRRVQKIACAVGAALLFSLSFGGFSTWQYLRIDREMQLKLENQSYVLAEYSTAELAAGDPDTALLLALSGLPNDFANPERPLVAAPQKALADALGVYDLADGHRPHKRLALPVAASKLALSPGERYGLAVYPFELRIFDPESGETSVTLPTVRSALADAEFLSDETVVYAGENGAEAYDVANHAVLWRGDAATAIAVSYDKKVVAAVDRAAGEALVYNASGEQTGSVSFNGKKMRVPADDSFLNPHDTLFELSADGAKLAVSFEDGSLSLFDVATGEERILYHSDRAFHFSGGFSGNTLAFAAVEGEPFSYNIQAYDAAGEVIASYISESSRFIPFTGREGVYFAIGNQIIELDLATGETALIAAAGGAIEAFSQRGGEYLVCQSSGVYSFYGVDGVREHRSDHVCNFPVMGDRYSLTGGYDSNIVRVLRREDYSGANVLEYDGDYDFSEAKIHPANGRAAFYSYRGLRLCELNGNIIAETAFPSPDDVLNTEYDKESGNISVIYKDAFLLYSGLDGSLLLEAQGKTEPDNNVESVIYTKFGVSVLDENGLATLYDFTGGAVASAQARAEASAALEIGGHLLEEADGKVFWEARELAAGTIIGADKNNDGSYSVAVATDAGGKIFIADGGGIKESFAFVTRGRSEAYFRGGFTFVSPLHGGAAAYTQNGEVIRMFDESGYLAEIEELGEFIAANYVSASGERYTFLLTRDTLETVAELPGFLGELEPGVLVLDSGGALRSQRLLGLQELTGMASGRLNGRTLTPEEKDKYNAW